MQEIEFIIYPDGRVEERVIGVKGENCQQLTAKLSEAPARCTAPTEEMFEQAVELEQEAEVGQEVSAWGRRGATAAAAAAAAQRGRPRRPRPSG